MERDEQYLRQQVKKLLNNHVTKYIRNLTADKVDAVCDETVRAWNQGGMRGTDALVYAVRYAKANFKVKAK